MIDLQNVIQKLDALYAQDDQEHTEAVLLDYIAQYDAQAPDDLSGRSVLYNELGGFYRHNRLKDCGRKAFENARDLLRAALEKTPGEPSLLMNLATTVNNLAGTCRVLHEYDLALKHFDMAIMIYQSLPGTPPELYASAHNNKGLVYLDKKDAANAEACFRRALTIVDGEGYAVGATYSNLAFALLRKGDKKASAEAFRKAAACFANGSGNEELQMSCLDMAAKLEAEL